MVQLSSALTDLMSLTYITVHLFLFRFAGSEQYWLYIWTFFETWGLELSPDFMLLTFMAGHQMSRQLIMAITGFMLLVFMSTHHFQ